MADTDTTPPPLPVQTVSPETKAALAGSIEILNQQIGNDLQLELEGETPAQITALVKEIDLADSNSIIFFGAKAQQQLTTISDSMLESVRTKEMGPAGDALNKMVQTLRTLDVASLDPNDKPGFFARLFGAKNEVMKVLDNYEDVRSQIEKISFELEQHKTKMLIDINKLDKLYDANLDYFRTLELYIAAGRAKLAELDATTIPALAKDVETSSDVTAAQKLRDLRSARDDLERRTHDLLLTRQVTMQGLPSIRLVQENDKSLVTKINSTLANTVPLWKQQLAQAITIFRSGEASKAVTAASDLTNELLKSNAENLKQVNAQVRKEVERGVFDIEVVKQANEQLIQTIEESLQIADAGKAKRIEAEKALIVLEAELKKTLSQASARMTGAAGAPVTPAG